MPSRRVEPRVGGVKIVFDVPEEDADRVASQMRSAGFDVQRYYAHDEHRRGGSPQGFVRLGAERALTEFTTAESDRIVAAFDDAQRANGFMCERVGVDSWTTGGAEPVT